MSANMTTLASGIENLAKELIRTADYIDTPLRNMLPSEQSGGGSAYNWVVQYGDNASTQYYAEGDAPVAAGNASYATCTLAYSTGYLETRYEITGHALDACKGGKIEALAAEAKSAVDAHMHGREGLCVTQALAGIDDDATYAGQTRATVKMAAYAPSAISTLALSDLNTLWTTLQTDPLIAPVERMVFLSAIGVRNAYAAVGAGVAYMQYDQTRGQVLDAGKLGSGMAFNSRPFMDVPTITDGTLLFVDLSQIVRVEHRPVTIQPLAITQDKISFLITSSEITVVKNPKIMAKLIEI